ncbi:protein translocase subunit SecF [Flexibacterium corallicola]|uniref:protein translocase subunit SecF n=1 Tax=Flexibacterium corallicola TaxID=3037259 RepID=UPI00286F0580|nr:protein translocase subunit SecF [Pseudovibrio sp. M1P-2-3]
MKLLRLVPEKTNFRFMKWRRITFPAAVVMAIAAVAMFFTIGLNFGVDFEGGTLIEIKTTNGPADISQIRADLSQLDLGDVQVQEFGNPSDVLIRIEQQGEGGGQEQLVLDKVKSVLSDNVEIRRTEVVGPRVSGELAVSGVTAVVSSLVLIMFYIWFRFEWQFALGAIITTFNDILLTAGLFVILQLDFSLSSIAAVLTIIGYSLNDTVVVYDRIRENMRRYKKMTLEDLLDRSINETLSRTTMTSFTTLLALFALAIFGGEVIRSFVLAMIFGVVIGTYSSIFLAAPLLLLMRLRRSAFDKSSENGDHKQGGAAA